MTTFDLWGSAYALSILFIILLGWIALYRKSPKVLAAILILCAIPAVTYATYLPLGHPAPSSLIDTGRESRILGFHFVPNYAIYLLLQQSGDLEPILVSIPWNDDQADQLSNAAAEARNQSGTLGLDSSSTEAEGEFVDYEFYVIPPPQK